MESRDSQAPFDCSTFDGAPVALTWSLSMFVPGGCRSQQQAGA